MKHTLSLLTALLLAASGALAREPLSLDGTWQIVFARNNEGGAKQWVSERFRWFHQRVPPSNLKQAPGRLRGTTQVCPCQGSHFSERDCLAKVWYTCSL